MGLNLDTVGLVYFLFIKMPFSVVDCAAANWR